MLFIRFGVYCAAFLSLFLHTPVLAQNNNLATSSRPTIVEHSGDYYVAFHSREKGNRIVVAELQVRDSGISVQRTTTLESRTKNSPAIASYQGNLWVAFISNDDKRNIMLKQHNGTRWLRAERLPFKAIGNLALVDLSGYLTLVWNAGCPGCSPFARHTYYAQRRNQRWTQPQKLPAGNRADLASAISSPKSGGAQGETLDILYTDGNWLIKLALLDDEWKHARLSPRPKANYPVGWKGTALMRSPSGVRVIAAVRENGEGSIWTVGDDWKVTKSLFGFRSRHAPALSAYGIYQAVLATTSKRRVSATTNVRDEAQIDLELVDLRDSFSVSTITQPIESTSKTDSETELIAPTNLTIAAQRGRTVTLRWRDNSETEDGYRIDFFAGRRFIRFYEARSSDSKGETSHTITVPNVPTREICFQVRAYKGDAGRIGTATSQNASAPSERVCGQSQGVDPARFEVPAAPSNLRVELISRTHVRLFWQDNSDIEEGWLVDRGVASGSVRWESEPITVPNLIESDGPTTGERDIDLRNMPPGILPLCFRIQAIAGSRKSENSTQACTPQRRLVR